MAHAPPHTQAWMAQYLAHFDRLRDPVATEAELARLLAATIASTDPSNACDFADFDADSPVRMAIALAQLEFELRSFDPGIGAEGFRELVAVRIVERGAHAGMVGLASEVLARDVRLGFAMARWLGVLGDEVLEG